VRLKVSMASFTDSTIQLGTETAALVLDDCETAEP
jgi:hypothetical protein